MGANRSEATNNRTGLFLEQKCSWEPFIIFKMTKKRTPEATNVNYKRIAGECLKGNTII